MKLRSFLLFILLLGATSLSSAADPAWWITRGVKSASPASNLSPATIGQAKHMAAMALAELQTQLSPADYSALQSQVAAIVNFTTPQTPAEFDNQKMVLLTGQLKAMAKPFYDKLRTLDAAWLDNEMVSANIRVVEPGSNPIAYSPYPWSVATSDDQNKAVATLGQLKAVFSLRFETIDTDHDGLPDAWERLYFPNLDQTPEGDADGDGLSNALELAFGFDPSVSNATTDSDGDGLPDIWEIDNAGKFAAYPPLLTATLDRNQTLNVPVILSNDTAAAIDYSISLAGNTGPSYSYKDSVSGSIAYQWQDISTTGTLLATISADDDSSEEVTIFGFTFPFFGREFSKVHVGSNGILTFNTGCNTGSNQPIPGATAPADLIAPFWDDLDPRVGGDVYVKNEADHLIVQFQEVARYSGAGTYTFQVVLFSNGNIEFRYKSMTGITDSSSIGIQDSSWLGFNVPAESLFPGAGIAVLITPQSQFFTVPSLAGTIPAHSTAALSGTFRSLSLPATIYQAGIAITQIGTANPPQNLIARLNVTDHPSTVALEQPAAGGALVQGIALELIANATDADGVAKVEFHDGGTLLGQAYSPPYSFLATGLSPGTHSFTATATDIFRTRTTSAPVSFTILVDSDSDHMPDVWEIEHGFDPQFNDPYGDPDRDPDRDGYTNLEEYNHSTDPRVPDNTADGDNDGMWDRWETLNGLDPGQNDSALNPDSDSLTNLLEFIAGTDPQSADTDSDGMPDGWETTHSLDPLLHNDGQDADGDGYTNLEEYQNSTDPQIPNNPSDLDSDGMLDRWEQAHGLIVPSDDSGLDLDGDGLTNIEEFTLRTHPDARDSDMDDLPDGWEHTYQLNPNSGKGTDGTHGDPDGDGVTNLDEFLNGTNPKHVDTDGDGASDLVEITQGSDPNDPADGGNAPLDTVEELTFKVFGDYASWQMEIQAEGPRDHRKLLAITPNVGVPGVKAHKLWRGNKYKVTLHHTGTKDAPKKPWFCWQAQIDNQPGEQTFPDYNATRNAGVAEFFAIGGGNWIVDNRPGLLTSHIHQRTPDAGNVAGGLEAILLPVDLDLDVNGDGDLGDSCDGVTSYVPGYELNSAKLHSGVSFETAQYSGPQAMNLIIDGLPSGAVDQASVRMSASSWSGYCGNGIIPNESPLLPFMDFSLTGQETVTSIQEVMVPITGNKMIHPIYCHDYGAWCEVEVTLKKGGAVVCPPIKISLPGDGTGDKIADRWQKQQIDEWNTQYGTTLDNTLVNLKNTWSALSGDNEMIDPDQSGPLYAHKTTGDGLDVIKEYRGFVVDSGFGASCGHMRMSVSRKEVLMEMSEMSDIATAISNGTNPGAVYDLQVAMNSVCSFYASNLGIHLHYVVDVINAPVNIASAPATSSYSSVNYNLGGPNYLYGDQQLAATDPVLHNANYTMFNGVYLPHGFQDSRHANYTGLSDFLRFRINSRDVWNMNYSGNYVIWKSGSANASWDIKTSKGARIQAAAIAEEGGAFTDILAYAIAHELGHLLNSSSGGHDGGNSPSALMSDSASAVNTISNIQVTFADAASLDIPTRRSTQ